MKIKILGTRGEIDESLPYHSKHSGVLINDELLLDLGEKEFLSYDPTWILITHLHPDHAYFVRLGKEEKPPTPAIIYAPELPKAHVNPSTIHVMTETIHIGSYTIIPIPTHHSKTVKSQAYLIQTEETSILYTGDLIWIDKQYHPLFAHVDLVITEGSFMRKGGMIRKDKETQMLYGHTGIPNLIDLFKIYTHNILFIHFGSWFYKNTKTARQTIITLGKEKGVNAIIGYDGLEISI
jgi:glyoxylase-like metal-dependent hydrolase (beta-lactamase superfamily II)